ncbi:nuclear transport factor 2 family protein [Labrenzia sp. OB1]|uniref:nuclear transport factor 2 family protein n=1 Tax=Labrenzia sp. OB1 TaxID=1561204 RepID=UPI0008390CFA|nr:nuclear transport factor 2 family protein [Labrenzia sp. OB1]
MHKNNNDLKDFAALLRKGLGDALDADAVSLLDMCSEDIAFEFPYAPPGAVKNLQGKQSLAQYLPRVGALIELTSLTLHAVTTDPDRNRFVLEFSCRGKSRVNGAPYDQDYISVIDMKNGRIVSYRDYWNPLVVQAAAGDRDTLERVLSAETPNV